MAEERRSRTGRRVTLLLLLAAALAALRLLGPGGRPAEEPAAAPAGPVEGGAAKAPDAPAPAPAKDGVLRGRVLGPDGAPVEGASVEASLEVEGEPQPRVLRAGPTGPDGRFSLGAVPGRRERLLIRVSKGPLSVEAGLSDAPGALDLDLRLPPSFHVGGIVVSAEEGRPLAGIEVRWGEIATRSDDLGRFAFRDVDAAVLAEPLPELELSGPGRRAVRRPLPRDRGLDDLLVRMEGE